MVTKKVNCARDSVVTKSCSSPPSAHSCTVSQPLCSYTWPRCCVLADRIGQRMLATSRPGQSMETSHRWSAGWSEYGPQGEPEHRKLMVATPQDRKSLGPELSLGEELQNQEHPPWTLTWLRGKVLLCQTVGFTCHRSKLYLNYYTCISKYFYPHTMSLTITLKVHYTVGGEKFFRKNPLWFNKF